MPYRPIAHVPIPAPVPHYQVPVPQYQAPQPQFQTPPPQHQQRNQQNNQPRPVQQQRPNQQRPYQQYNNVNTTPIPMTYTQLLPYLIQNGTVVPRALPPMLKPHKPCWGTVIELPEKKDKCGLGYQPSIELFKDQNIHQGKVPSIQEIFSKAGFRSDDQVNALEDEDPDLSKMVFRGPPDAALTNWKATDVPDIVSYHAETSAGFSNLSRKFSVILSRPRCKVIDVLPLELWCQRNFCLVSPVDNSTQSFSNIVFSPAKFHELPSKSLGSSHSPKESSVSEEQLNMRLFPKGSILFIFQQFASTKSS
ncbi:hypothetical protein KIW84_042362 [Lathyrus oleraceus]|uniref:Uncharacterized protein n=1 Tax=Pisum sativum TaxID=3888 RepID=A0A9D4XAR8_PEA|nr:hypothetical protein KIW84_042362 [Pisum sativum]